MALEGSICDGEVALGRVGCSEGAVSFKGRCVDVGVGGRLHSGFSDYF